MNELNLFFLFLKYVPPIALVLLIGGELYDLAFYRDISLALIFFGFVGTVAFAVTLGGEDK